MADLRDSLLRPGVPGWAAINEAERADRREWAFARTIPELIAAGTELSRVAHAIRTTVGPAPEPDVRPS